VLEPSSDYVDGFFVGSVDDPTIRMAPFRVPSARMIQHQVLDQEPGDRHGTHMELATVKLVSSRRKPQAKRGQGVRKLTARSAVSNGRDILPKVDGRSLIGRRYYDIQTAILIDQGGADQVSETRLQLVRRFSAAAVMAELLEAKLANGEEIDIQQHALLSSTMVRVAQRIGIDRIPKDVEASSLDEYLSEKAIAE
jgi:hypothetical protein